VTDANAGDAGETEIVVTRVFKAPRAVVFNFWTDPEQLAKWWGPVGYHNPREDVAMDRHVGGRFQLRMVETATGAEVWVRGEIAELVEPEVLAIDMDVPRPIGLPPMKTRVRVEFHDLGDTTRVTLRQGPFLTTEQREQTATGWDQSFDTIDQLLAADGQQP
jgi:uncharacterized protein YndB with AHSA1/START domain